MIYLCVRLIPKWLIAANETARKGKAAPIERDGWWFAIYFVNSFCMFRQRLLTNVLSAQQEATRVLVIVSDSDSYAANTLCTRTQPHMASQPFSAFVSFSWYRVSCARIHQSDLVHSRDWTQTSRSRTTQYERQSEIGQPPAWHIVCSSNNSESLLLQHYSIE